MKKGILYIDVYIFRYLPLVCFGIADYVSIYVTLFNSVHGNTTKYDVIDTQTTYFMIIYLSTNPSTCFYLIQRLKIKCQGWNIFKALKYI